MLLRPISCDSFGTTPTTVYRDPSSRMSLPTTARSALKRVRQNGSLKTTTLARRLSSEGRKVRPTMALTPSTSKTPAVTHWRETVSAVPSAPAITMPPTPGTNPAMRSNVRVRSFQSRRLSGATPSRCDRSVCSQIITRRSGSGNGRGRSSVASTSAKIALLAPMPSASVIAAMHVKPGERFSCLHANRTSSRSSSIHCVRRMSRSRFLPRSRHVCLRPSRSPSRASASLRAAFGSKPPSTSSRVRIST